jgi:cobalamin synthase
MSLSNALSYLTVLPIPFKKHLPLNRSVHHFPVVGAGMGSIAVLALLLFKSIFPPYLACLATLVLLEAMTGGIHLRAVAELIDGQRTFPGSGFGLKSEYHWKGILGVALLMAIKISALAHTRPDWQPFAVLLAPILGRSSQALGIIFSKHRLESAKGKLDPEVKSRQRRALIITALLLISMGLFPWKIAAILIAQYFLIMVAAFRFLNAKMEGLTVQSLGTVAEVIELTFLLFCAGLS